LEHVPTDANGAIDSSRLPELIKRCLIIAQAGNVISGSFDPIEEICRKADAAGSWVQIVGAFGLWPAGCARTWHPTRGIEKADSCSVDAHKTLNVPYDCGIVFCRHAKDMVMAMQLSGSYI
jgi:glutamate/tyrosine decarboxylase-like PLP-dependent enzyme